MSDRNAILEAMARAILQNSNADISPTPDLPSDKNPMVKLMREWETAMGQAAAVLELVGPKPLVWMRNGSHWACGLGWVVRKMGSQYVLTKASRFDQNFDTLEAAQAAAQAHADAAHWANTNIGGE